MIDSELLRGREPIEIHDLVLPGLRQIFETEHEQIPVKDKIVGRGSREETVYLWRVRDTSPVHGERQETEKQPDTGEHPFEGAEWLCRALLTRTSFFAF